MIVLTEHLPYAQYLKDFLWVLSLPYVEILKLVSAANELVRSTTFTTNCHSYDSLSLCSSFLLHDFFLTALYPISKIKK